MTSLSDLGRNLLFLASLVILTPALARVAWAVAGRLSKWITGDWKA